jgi:hypothetical protein
MANFSKNFLTSMTGHMNLEDDPKPKPVSGSLPLYKPKDVNIIQIDDKRELNPATGQPFKVKGTKSIKANQEDISAIVSQAKSLGVDPYTALAVALQETEIGRLDPNYGSAWATFPDEGIEDEKQQNANILAKTIKEKLAYAKELKSKGKIGDGEAFELQAYNGLGVLKPRLEVEGKLQGESYYGLPVTEKNPLDLRKNPVYGKYIMQLRDEVLKSNPMIRKIVEATPPYQNASQKSLAKK